MEGTLKAKQLLCTQNFQNVQYSFPIFHMGTSLILEKAGIKGRAKELYELTKWESHGWHKQ